MRTCWTWDLGTPETGAVLLRNLEHVCLGPVTVDTSALRNRALPGCSEIGKKGHCFFGVIWDEPEYPKGSPDRHLTATTYNRTG